MPTNEPTYHSPITDAALRPVQYEGVLVHTDDVSGGELIGADQLQHIVATRAERFGALADESSSWTPRFGVPEEERQRHMECPMCKGTMSVVNYAGDTSVFIDKCGSCGAVWLDHEELEKIQSVCEAWRDAAPEQLRAIAGQLEASRRQASANSEKAFQGSRFSFVNALINRVLDAA